MDNIYLSISQILFEKNVIISVFNFVFYLTGKNIKTLLEEMMKGENTYSGALKWTVQVFIIYTYTNLFLLFLTFFFDYFIFS